MRLTSASTGCRNGEAVIFNAAHCTDICHVVEEVGLTVTLRQKSAPYLFVEWMSEDWDTISRAKMGHKYFIHPQVPITYLGIHSEKRTVAEFQLGNWPIIPAEPDVVSFLSELMARQMNFRPVRVARQTMPSFR